MISLRQRRNADLPTLCEVVAEQQARTRYPMRWPLPMPVADFIRREHDEAAWVAADEHRPIGHVAVAPPAGGDGLPFADFLGHSNYALVTSLFVGTAELGRGIGGLLLDTAVAHICESGRTPVLDVVPLNDRALGMYRVVVGGC